MLLSHIGECIVDAAIPIVCLEAILGHYALDGGAVA